MSQFESEATFQPPIDEPRTTSGLAVAALICSLIICCPITTIVGPLLGVVALLGMGQRKGRGLAIAAIIIGILATVVVGGGLAIFTTRVIMPSVRLVTEGPCGPIQAGFNGDVAGFKGAFYGAGATASDAEAQAFIDALRGRYGEYVSCTVDETNPGGGQPGQASGTFNYVITFDQGPVEASTETIFADQQTGEFVMKLGSVTVYDPDEGDLVYPASAAPPAGP